MSRELQAEPGERQFTITEPNEECVERRGRLQKAPNSKYDSLTRFIRY